MSKELEALQKLRGLVEYLTRIDYVPTDLRNEVKELLINSYANSNGYFSQIEEALKRNEPVKLLKEKKYLHEFEWYTVFGKCPLCNHYNPSTANYCGNCGQALEKLDWSDE